jgi:hypothetical protein
METPKAKSPVWASLASILMTIAIFLSGLYAPKGWNWALVMFLMIVFIALIGWLITGRPSGIFINELNKMTMSRFQLVIWTVIVLSAFLTIALERIKAGSPTPLDIALPQQLWALLGISTTSLVGSPLILSTKVQKTPTPGAIRKAAKILIKKGKDSNKRQILADAEETDAPQQKKDDAEKLIGDAEKIIRENAKVSGVLDSNPRFGDANFSEMFTGDEIANKGFVDMAKVQMFFFTLIIAFSYMVLLVNLIMTADPAGPLLNSFPPLNDSLVALLGISSAGYLTSKTVGRTTTL